MICLESQDGTTISDEGEYLKRTQSSPTAELPINSSLRLLGYVRSSDVVESGGEVCCVVMMYWACCLVADTAYGGVVLSGCRMQYRLTLNGRKS
jgi:hypothetical protein